jgi:hypothetical protein
MIGAALCAGCSGTIFKRANMEDGDSFFLDARQRVVSNVALQKEQFDNGQITPRRVVCAEPSPDVALAMARSFGAGVNVLTYGSGNVSGASSEALTQLAERFAAVQLLRDILYRSCEAYANGAISNTAYALMMARLDETTTTILLGEMAAGAFGRQLAAAQGSADAKSTTSLTETRNPGSNPGDAAQPAAPTAGAGGGAAAGRQVQGTTETDLKTATTALSGLGAISGRSPAGEVAGEVARIHKSYLDDDNLDALLVACITTLSHEPVQNEAGKETSLSRICKREIFEGFIGNVKKVIEAKASAEVQVSRARNEAGYVEAVNKCLAAFGNDAKQMCAPLINALSEAASSPGVTPVAAKQ